MRNYIEEGNYLSVACTDPAAPTSGAPVRVGDMMGVAETAEGDGGNASTEATVQFGQGVFDLSVAAVDDAGNAAVAFADKLYYVDADTPKLSKKQSGRFFGFALEAINAGVTDTINVLKPAPVEAGSGTKRVGFHQFDITTARIINANAVPNLTEAGVPDGNTSPSLARVNADTDKALRLAWAATAVEEIQFAPFVKPPDMDGDAPLVVHLLLAKDANANAGMLVGVFAFDGVGDANCGGNTAALAAAALTEYTVTLTAANIADHPGFLNIGIIPGAHANDALYLYAAWLEYQRK